MKNIKKHLRLFNENPLSVIIRTNDSNNAKRIIQNTIKSGFKFIEITLTTPNVYQIIAETRKKYPEVIIGAGTVLILEEAKKVVQAGAQYLVSPVFTKEILKWSLENDILYAPGVMTVNEMYQAYQKGSQLLKFYPAISLSTEALKLISNPFPNNFKILATGGISLDNIDSYFDAGVYAVGITGKLGGANIETTDQEISDLAKKYVEKVKKIVLKRGFCDCI
ncbi:bifunctional 4-hydroxy-2-oxoglutarate aldolase/2-dehydro-3-deoxy-phosphogluconate aldolase [Candidatus Phytoplasma pyri]|uniref:bifunctional 4-hydroxy-2-oxoglutarate aldolase/2-dehydro-3-deoxy-phosphogluconate aldolase n=1 Tax=Candidatus Phytoplasma pyri TaxID=47566 RepID=UPI0039833FD7